MPDYLPLEKNETRCRFMTSVNILYEDYLYSKLKVVQADNWICAGRVIDAFCNLSNTSCKNWLASEQAVVACWFNVAVHSSTCVKKCFLLFREVAVYTYWHLQLLPAMHWNKILTLLFYYIHVEVNFPISMRSGYIVGTALLIAFITNVLFSIIIWRLFLLISVLAYHLLLTDINVLCCMQNCAFLSNAVSRQRWMILLQ